MPLPSVVASLFNGKPRFFDAFYSNCHPVMKQRIIRWAAILIFGCVGLQSLKAQSSKRFTIARAVVASGGATLSASSRFQLASTIGQPLAAVLSSSRFLIQGGFWIWPAPSVFAPMKTGVDFIFSIQTDLGKNYVVQYTDGLTSPSWQNLLSISGNGTAESVTNSAPGIAQRFYRVIEQ